MTLLCVSWGYLLKSFDVFHVFFSFFFCAGSFSWALDDLLDVLAEDFYCVKSSCGMIKVVFLFLFLRNGFVKIDFLFLQF